MRKIFPMKKLLVVLAFVAVLFVYYNQFNETSFIQDDAYTSLRYAENFIEGKGLVFNQGEFVEGYTNFFWVMLLSGSTFATYHLAHALNHNLELKSLLEMLTQLLSVLFAALQLIIIYILTTKIFSSKDFSKSTGYLLIRLLCFVPIIMILFSTPFIYWSVSGMETSLFVLLTLLSIFFFINRDEGKKYQAAFIVVSILNSLTRPEGIIFFVLILIFDLFQRFFDDEEIKYSKRIKNLFDRKFILFTATYLVPYSLYIIFRLYYYGYPLPNTYYAKTEFSEEFLLRGINYISSFAEAYLLWGILLVPVLVQLFRRRLVHSEKLILWISIAYSLLLILIGGDVLPIHRFFLPIMPLIFILVVKCTYDIIEEFSPNNFLPIPALVLSISLIALAVYNYETQKPEMMEKRAYESGLVAKMKVYADWIKKTNQKKSVAMSTIGAFSFFSDAKVIDLVGLTDEYTAHNPLEEEGINEELPVLWKERHYNAQYVISCKPDFIIFPAGAKPSAFAECALFIQPEFYQNYYIQIFYSKELHQLLPIFTRKENVRADSSKNCDISFLVHYINANNLFLKMLETKSRKLLQPIFAELDDVLSKCPLREADVYTLKGMCFYHLKNFNIAKFYLQSAAKKDSSNSIARYYLMSIFNKEGNTEEVYKCLAEIMKFSPDALPNSNGDIFQLDETSDRKKTYN